MNVEIEVKLLIEADSRLEGLTKLVNLLDIPNGQIEIFELFLLRGAPVAEIPLEESDPCDHEHQYESPTHPYHPTTNEANQ